MGTGVLTPSFPRVAGELHAGSVPLSELAGRFGTPLFVYDLDHVEARYRLIEEAFRGMRPLVAYSVKANGNLAVLAHLASLGAGADIVSQGELVRARRAGIPASRIVFAGVAKKEDEMRAGLREGILAFNVESRGELERLDRVASQDGAVAPFAIRVNPDVLSPTPHEYTRTGHAASKFGVPVEETVALYRWARERPGLRAVGIDVHIGSQILEAEPYERAAARVLELVAALADEGIDLDVLDLGGGFGLPPDDGTEDEPVIHAVARRLRPLVEGTGLRLVLEPGRFVVGEAGVLLTRVEYVKRTGGKTFVIVDGGMTELIRPSHYGGYHAIEAVVESPAAGDAPEPVDVVGPICETGDFLARDREMPVPEPGTLLAVRTAGAYGFAMASNYNARRRPAEAVVRQGMVFLARERESFDDLMRGERLPERHPPVNRHETTTGS